MLLSRPSVAVGEFSVTHNELCAHLGNIYGETDDIARKMRAVKNCGVLTHHLCRPLAEVIPEQPQKSGKSLLDKARAYQEDAYRIAERAARGALDSAGVAPEQIGAVITSTSAVYNTPSIDVELIDRLGLPAAADRIPLSNLGCVGAATGLARAADFLRSRPTEIVLVVVVDLPTYLINPTDTGIDNMILRGLSSDGASALVAYGEEAIPHGAPGPRVVDTWSVTDAKAKNLVGWWADDTGNHMKNSGDLMSLLEDLLGDLRDWLGERPEFVIPHPGSLKIIDIICDTLGCDRVMGWAGRDSLRHTGHTVGSAVLDVLRRTFDDPPRTESSGVLLAIGPGMTLGASKLVWH